MLRTLAALGLTFGALAWVLFASTFVFFYGSSFWIGALGRFGAFWGAFVAFLLALYVARAMLRLADKLNEPLTGAYDKSIYDNSPADTLHRDWQRYAADVARNRRYAFFMRTRQWDKAAAVEREIQIARRQATDTVPEPPHPLRTSMAHRATWDERQRAARRMSGRVPVLQKWRVEED